MSAHRLASSVVGLGLLITSCSTSLSDTAPNIRRDMVYMFDQVPGFERDLAATTQRQVLRLAGQMIDFVTTPQETELPYDANKLLNAASSLIQIAQSRPSFRIPVTRLANGAHQDILATTAPKPNNKHYLIFEHDESETPAISGIVRPAMRRAFTISDLEAKQPTLSLIVDSPAARATMYDSAVPANYNATITELTQALLKVDIGIQGDQQMAELIQEEVANSIGRLVSFASMGEPYSRYVHSLSVSPLEIGGLQGYNIPYLQFSEAAYNGVANGSFDPKSLGSYQAA